MKTYLVTGAAGFTGANYIKYLLHEKYVSEDIKAIVLDALTYAGNLGTIKNDIDNKYCIFIKGDTHGRELADKLFAEYDINYLVSLAAESHVNRSIEDPQLFLPVGILGTQNLMDAVRCAWATGKDEQGYPTWKEGKRYHQVSTDGVYDSSGAEGYLTEETPFCPHSPYSASKTSADHFIMAYHDAYHMPISTTHCLSSYGTYHFPEKLVPLIIDSIFEGRKLPIYDEGLNVRDWLYIEDRYKAIDMVVRKGYVGEVCNVGGHNETKNTDTVKLTIKTIYDMMAEDRNLRAIFKKQVKDANGDTDISWINEELIACAPDRLDHDARYAIGPAKIRNEPGWYPETISVDGIIKTIRQNLEHQDWIQEATSGDYRKYYDMMYTKKRRQ